MALEEGPRGLGTGFLPLLAHSSFWSRQWRPANAGTLPGSAAFTTLGCVILDCLFNVSEPQLINEIIFVGGRKRMP